MMHRSKKVWQRRSRVLQLETSGQCASWRSAARRPLGAFRGVANDGSGVVVLGAAAGSQRGGVALAALGFFGVEILVRFRKQFFDPFTIASIDRDANAGGERGLFLV